MKLIKITMTAACIVSSSLFTVAINAAEVRAISREIPIDGATIPSWQVNVECAEVEDLRAIQRVGDKGKWCSVDFPEICVRKKIKMADKVCGTHFGRRLDALIGGDAPAVEKAVKPARPVVEEKVVEEKVVEEKVVEEKVVEEKVIEEQVSVDTQTQNMTEEMFKLEQQRILIEEQRIKLKLREIEMRKRDNSNS